MLAEKCHSASSRLGSRSTRSPAAIARALGESATALAAAARLREAVVDRLISTEYSPPRRSGRCGVRSGGRHAGPHAQPDPLSMRIADAYGFELDRERIPEVLGVIGNGPRLPGACAVIARLRPIAAGRNSRARLRRNTRARRGGSTHFEARAPVTRVAGDRVVSPPLVAGCVGRPGAWRRHAAGGEHALDRSRGVRASSRSR